MATSTAALGPEEIRRKKGISLDEISGATKIGTVFLRAIESEEFEKLPGGLFDRSYIRQYAAALAIDAQPLLDRYAEYLTEREVRENPPAARRTSPLRWIVSLVTSLVAVLSPNT